MTTSMQTSLSALLSTGRPPKQVVAHTAASSVDWQAFLARIEAAKATLTATNSRRTLLTQADPLDFLIQLLAAVSAGLTPVIPPNFQPATLLELAPRLDLAPALNTASIELFTSGSSGEPKRITKKLAQLEAECQALEALWGEQLGNATMLATVPHHHIYGLLFRLLWPLLAGRPFDAVTAGDPTTLYARLNTSAKIALVSSPAQLARLPELHDLQDFPARPALVFSSGGPLAGEVAQNFLEQWGHAPYEVFGSTESGGIAWRQQISGNVAWKPLLGVSVELDSDGALQVTSPFLESDQPLRMEDGAALLPDGRFMLTGRLDRVVKIEEKRLSLVELEARLLTHPWVKLAATAPVVAANGRRTVVGAVVVPTAEGLAALQGDRRNVTQALRLHLTQHFDHVLLPRRWRFVEQLPYNERGKLPLNDIVAMLNTHTEEIEA